MKPILHDQGIVHVVTEEQKQEVQRAKETEKSARERLKDVQQKMKVFFFIPICN